MPPLSIALRIELPFRNPTALAASLSETNWLPVSAQRTFFAVGWLHPLLSRLSGAGFTYSHVYPPALCLLPRATALIELLFIPVSREASAMDSYIFPVSKHRMAVFLGTAYSSALSILDSKSSG